MSTSPALSAIGFYRARTSGDFDSVAAYFEGIGGVHLSLGSLMAMAPLVESSADVVEFLVEARSRAFRSLQPPSENDPAVLAMPHVWTGFESELIAMEVLTSMAEVYPHCSSSGMALLAAFGRVRSDHLGLTPEQVTVAMVTAFGYVLEHFAHSVAYRYDSVEEAKEATLFRLHRSLLRTEAARAC